MPRAATSIRWWVYAPATPKLEALMADPEAVLAGPGILARELTGRKRFFRVDAQGAEPALYVKVFALPRGAKRLRYFLLRSKARREHAIAARIERLGFEVAGPAAVGERRRMGVLERSYSVVREIDARDLVQFLRSDRLGVAERRSLLERFGALARRLHDAGVDQEDFAPNNFLMRPDGALVMIDFERCDVRRRALGAARWTQLAKLHRRGLGVSRSDRLRLLRAYLGDAAGREQRREAWQRIWPEFRRIRRHDARHAEASAFREGRNLAAEGDGWVMRARAEAKTIALELSPEAARTCWLRALQLERLGLPALRAVRLAGGRVELLDPGAATPRSPADQLVARSLAALAPWGHFSAPPQWLFTEHGALLRNPQAFELDL